jgi:septum formation protein
MLARLSGRAHRVLTAVALQSGAAVESRLSVSEVRFRATTAEERLAYCATGEPFDKAGGYGIQGHAAVFVEELKGSYSGVVGLPLFETAALLARAGVGFWLSQRAA